MSYGKLQNKKNKMTTCLLTAIIRVMAYYSIRNFEINKSTIRQNVILDKPINYGHIIMTIFYGELKDIEK